MSAHSGRFITIDGPNGVGKSSVASALVSRLRRQGLSVIQTAEPTESDLGRVVRRLEPELSGRAYAALVASDRYHHLDYEVLPALALGKSVVSARYVDSSLALQGLEGVPASFIWELNATVRVPDLSVVLLAAPETLAARLAGRPALSHLEARFSRATECDAYSRAIALLRRRGFNVLDLANGDGTPVETTVDRIVRALVSIQSDGHRPKDGYHVHHTKHRLRQEAAAAPRRRFVGGASSLDDPARGRRAPQHRAQGAEARPDGQALR